MLDAEVSLSKLARLFVISKNLPKIDNLSTGHCALCIFRDTPDITQTVKVLCVREMAGVGANEKLALES